MASFRKIFCLASLCGLASSFNSLNNGQVGRRLELSMSSEPDFLTRITNTFTKEGSDDSISPLVAAFSSPDPLDSQDTLIGKAKAVVATDLGIQDPSLLAEDFLWIGPLLEKPLGKVDYLAAGRFFSLRTAFPDLDYRPHDFRVDENDPFTVRCTVRPLGVMRGPLRLRNELVPPNGKQWQGPPEAVSITFDPDAGKVVKLCSGFTMDRFVGNTNGLCGVMAAATIAGVPPSDWEVYPIPAVISRFFGRPVDPVGEVSTFLAPFPETVMIQLVKGILTTNLAAEDPSLLAKDFSFVTPTVGPIGKSKFLDSYAAQEFGGFTPQFSHFRVDPFDPYRVWVDVKPVGPGLEGPPQAFSFTFDDDGFCTRMTAGAVMDPSIGNTGGLTGAAGIKYAIGEGDFDITVRPLPVAIGRLKKTILSPLTKISADDYILDATSAKSEEKSESDSTEARKALAEARARIKEEEAQKLQVKAEEEARLQAQQELEQERLKAQQEAEQELRRRRMALDAEARQVAAAAKTPEIKIPSLPKITPPAEISPKKAPPPPSKAAPSKPSPPKEKPGVFFADAFKPLADITVPKPPSLSIPAAKVDTKEDKKAIAAARKKEMEKLEQQKVEAAKRKAEFEEARLKRLDEQKLAAEQKRLDLEKRKKEAAEALARKSAEMNALIAKRQKEAEEKRLEAEKKRQEALSKGTDAKPKPKPKRPASRPTIPLAKTTPKPKAPAPAPAPRPSFQIPQFAMPQPPNPAPSKPRASVQIPKPPTAKPKPPSSKPRPSLQIPQFSPPPPKEAPAPRPSVTIPKATKAPKGVPTIVAWRKNPSGGVSGQIFGSVNFKDGERVETSTIANGEFENGSIVTTESGSRYFLSGASVREMRAASASSAPKQPQATPPGKPRATLQLTKQAKQRDAEAARAALEAASKATSANQLKRPTFSLAALFGMDKQTETKTPTPTKPSIPSSKVSRSPVVKKAPQGVPSIGRWKQNRDKSITGFISGSPSFPDGERITTSPIARGIIGPGEVVVTASGSRYFLQ